LSAFKKEKQVTSIYKKGAVGRTAKSPLAATMTGVPVNPKLQLTTETCEIKVFFQ
jgi:hypothetical protein